MSGLAEKRGSPEGFLGEAYRWARFREEAVSAGGVGSAGSLRGAILAALEQEARPGLILEFKRCRPGRFVAYHTPWGFVEALGGVGDAWSVLVEPFWFCGSLELLPWFASTGKPVLAKDFVAGPGMLRAYRSLGASAVLLILDMLGWRRLGELYEEARGLGLEVLIETSSAGDAVDAMASFPEALVGINARNLRSLELSFERLLGEIEKAVTSKPSGALLVAESGIDSVEKAVAAARAGADALLIGTWASTRPREVAALPERLRGVKGGEG